MSHLTLRVSLDPQGHMNLVSQLSAAFSLNKGDSLRLELDLNVCYILYSDYLCLIASAVHGLEKKGVSVECHLIDFDGNSKFAQYASRMNFFQILRLDMSERFQRHSSKGQFTEISKFTQPNCYDLYKNIINVLIANNVNNDMLAILHYCLWEVIDNTLNHSGGNFTYGEGQGFLCSQYFPTKNKVRIMIADTGIGIHKGLTTHPDSEYKELSEYEAISRCIERGVTNSPQNRGFGLWATSAMVKENRARMMIHSGEHQLICSESNTIHKCAKWQGTYTFLELNTNNPIDYNVIFDTAIQKDSFQEYKESVLEEIGDDLW